MVAIFIHLDDTNKENGGLAVYPGSHLLGPQEDVGGDSGMVNIYYIRFTYENIIELM